MYYTPSRLFCIFTTAYLLSSFSLFADTGLVVVYPEEYSGALRNPLKGFRPDTGRNISRSRFVTLARHYIKWNDLEKRNTDDLVANIRAYSDGK